MRSVDSVKMKLPPVPAVLLCGVCLSAALDAAPPVVSNIRASQRPGTKLVDIYYDLVDADGDLQLIQVAASSDAGLTYGLPCSTLSGAVGAGVSPGTNRLIVWNAGADWDGNWVPECRVRVTAHDGTTPPAPPGMAYIPPGPFQMGDNLDGTTDAMPVHNVQVSGFFMDKTEVTKELWQSIQSWGNNNGYSIGDGSFSGDNHPVHSILWYYAVKWCNARSEKEGLSPCYYTDAAQTIVYRTSGSPTNATVDWNANGYRLPTEAEWEKAARGGATGLRFPRGDTISHEDANFRNDGGESYQSGSAGYHPVYNTGSVPYTSPVGSFPPNDYGLFDMDGNLWEWCWDNYSNVYYGKPESLSDPVGPDYGVQRVVRGSAWSSYARNCRVMHRYYTNQGDADYSIGFRSVRRPSP